MLPLLSPRLDDVPSVRVTTLDEVLRFKRQTKDIDLLTYDSVSKCKDVFGDEMTVEGRWKAPKNAAILRAGVHDLHIASGHTGAYKEPCEACRRRPEGQRHRGCPNHHDRARLYRLGDSTSNIIFTNYMEQLRKDDIAYEEIGRAQLLPSDLRLLCQHLLST
jgi:hypothetical protein